MPPCAGGDPKYRSNRDRRPRAHARHHHGHRMRVTPEALEEPGHLLMHHRVPRDYVVEVLLLNGGRQLPIEQEIAGLEEIAMFGDLLDRIAAIEQHTLVAVDIGDLRFATRRRGEARIIGEHSGLGIELADINNRRTDCSGLDRHLDGGIADAKGARRRAHGGSFP
jgi:hypothetical protein